MPISTKKGDQGSTSLIGGKRVPKYALRPETYGTIDELDAFVGMARAVARTKRVKEILLKLQRHFCLIGSDLALPRKDRALLKAKITEKEVDWLTRLSTELERSLKPDRAFILYGERLPSSAINVARAVSRRAERLVTKMKSKGMLHNPEILEYLNRLSDVLYLLARYEEKGASG